MVPSRISRHWSVITMASATRASKALVIEKRAATKLAKLAPPPRDMQLPIITLIVALLKERREKAIEEGKTGRGILKELMQERIIHFPWLTRNMVSHYMIT
jgi:hypothetical protein